MHDINKYELVVIDSSGLIRYFGETDEYRFHLEALKDYLYTYYDDLANEVNADSMRFNEEIIILLNNLNNIVYSHSVGYGLLFVAREINEKQKESLYELFSLLPEMPIYINYNLVKNKGGVEPQSVINSSDALDNVALLDEFFKSKKCVKKWVK